MPWHHGLSPSLVADSKAVVFASFAVLALGINDRKKYRKRKQILVVFNARLSSLRRAK
jgi:hypothetical protein